MNTPEWTTRMDDDDVAGEDHLGVEGAAQGYQQYLVPGIITTTDHARYYSFYCWVLHRFIFDPHSSRRLDDFGGTYYKRHEVAFILGCYSHHKASGGFGGLVGAGNNSAKARAMWENGDPASLDFTYFKNRLGGFGQYYRPAMQAMGLLEEPEGPRWVYRLTERGEALALAYDASIQTTDYARQLSRTDNLAVLSHDAAEEYGKAACLCHDALGQGADRLLLLDAFFRLADRAVGKPHVRRRLTLGLILDLVSKAEGIPFEDHVRSAIFLGQFAPNQLYAPEPVFADWYQRWQMVQVRHSYTSALQLLWATFLDHLANASDRAFSFNEFMEWVATQLPAGYRDLTVLDYLDQLCTQVGLSDGWEQAHKDFATACRQDSGQDEISLFLKSTTSQRNPSVLVEHALRILCQLYLRFLGRHRAQDALWKEMAWRPRLPISQFFNDLFHNATTQDWTLPQLLTWIYQEVILGQHEFIALEKLRYQEYNTFKFYYWDGIFIWADNPSNYREPLRFPSLRLYNGLTILVDLGLVEKDTTGVCRLTDDGQEYLARIIEAGDGN